MESVALIRNGKVAGFVTNSAAEVNYTEDDGSKKNLQNKIKELEEGGGGGNADFVDVTQEEYDELPDSKETDGVAYVISDADPMDAYNMPYKSTSVGDKLDGISQNIADKTIISPANRQDLTNGGTCDKDGTLRIMFSTGGAKSNVGYTVECNGLTVDRYVSYVSVNVDLYRSIRVNKGDVIRVTKDGSPSAFTVILFYS